MSRHKNCGYLVTTKDGLHGRTKHSDEHINGKLMVYLDNGEKRLCKPNDLKMRGFID